MKGPRLERLGDCRAPATPSFVWVTEGGQAQGDPYRCRGVLGVPVETEESLVRSDRG